VQPDGVVISSPAFDQHFSCPSRIEDLTVEQFSSLLSVVSTACQAIIKTKRSGAIPNVIDSEINAWSEALEGIQGTVEFSSSFGELE